MSYDRYERRQPSRGGLSYWIPLALSVTVATIGLAAWVWSERNDEEEEDHSPTGGPGGDNVYPRPDYGRNADGTLRTGPPSYADMRPGEVGYGTTSIQPPITTGPEQTQSYMATMSGALRRTPSPQQMFDRVSRTVVGGVAATGAVVGRALGSIMEEDKNAYRDHKTWSEEAVAQGVPAVSPVPPGGIEMRSNTTPGVVAKGRTVQNNDKRKTVAVVVSADTNVDDYDEDEYHENASIISHLPKNTDFSKIRLFVLIYSPNLKEHPLDTSNRPGSLSSSFSNIGHDQAQSPGEEVQKSLASGTAPTAFNQVFSQALTLVEKETMVLPFTTPSGHLHILRQLGPDLVYLQESLAGDNGDAITQLQSWLHSDVILVVGADGGHGGLADSESEAEHAESKTQKWWEREDRVGLGRGVVVVEGLRVGDDWARRVEKRE